MDRIIQVTGKSKVYIQPDTTHVSLKFVKEFSDYSEAVKASVNDVNDVKALLVDVGLKEDSLKTKDYKVSDYEKKIKDKNGKVKKTINEFIYAQTLEITFANDNEILGKILTIISEKFTNAKINLWYSFEDIKGLKDQSLIEAIDDAQRQVDIVCRQLGCKATIVNIDHRDNQYDSRFECFNYSSARLHPGTSSSDGGLKVDINPEEISVDDQITATYLIELN